MIRLAKEKDIQDILKVIKGSYASLVPEEEDYRLPKYRAKEIDYILNEPKSAVWVCEEGGQIVGVAAGIFLVPNTFHLKLMFVADGYQRDGVGTHLLESFEEEGKRLGCSLLTTNYLEWATWSGAFYTKHGYSAYQQGDEKKNQELAQQVEWRNRVGLLNNVDKVFVWKTV